jgi:hypothetical protein
MARPIYVVFKNRLTAAFLELSEEEQAQLMAEAAERQRQAGAKRIIVLDTFWSTEQWYWAGVVEFPDIDAFQEFQRMGREQSKSLYITSEIILGTKSEEF